MKFDPIPLDMFYVQQVTSSVGGKYLKMNVAAEHRLAQKASVRIWLIIAGLLLFILVASLPQFEIFQNWFGINGWIESAKNVMGWH